MADFIWMVKELWWLLGLLFIAAGITLTVVPYYEFVYQEADDE